jgi:large subunit ribosomal protein L21
MYAVISTGGKQYRVSEGQTIRVEKLPGEVGAPVSFDRVLLFSDGETVRVGQPTLDGMTVTGHIIQQGKAKKIIVFKQKRRKGYRKKQGHRQEFTALKIDTISGA